MLPIARIKTCSGRLITRSSGSTPRLRSAKDKVRAASRVELSSATLPINRHSNASHASAHSTPSIRTNSGDGNARFIVAENHRAGNMNHGARAIVLVPQLSLSQTSKPPSIVARS